MYNLSCPTCLGAAADYESSMEVLGELQCAIQAAGFNPGPLDGLWGKKTSAALNKFAKTIGAADGLDDATFEALGLDPAEVAAAITYQKGNKGERPVGFVPESAMMCGVPKVGAAGFFVRNWKWMLGLGVASAAAIGIGIYVAKKRGASPSMGTIYTYNNPYLKATYGRAGRGRRGLGYTYSNPWLKQAGYAGRARGRRGLGYTYNNVWLKQAGYAGRRR